MKPITSKALLSGLALVSAVALSACSSSAFDRRAATEKNPAPCPNVLVLSEAARMIEFAGEAKTLENIAYTGEILDVRTICRYYDEEPIEASVEIDFAFGRGPMATERAKNVNYFVAVTRTDRDLIAKQEFTIPVQFRGDRAVVTLKDSVDQIVIPRKDGNVSGVNFEIIVGLSLTRDQVVYNRSGKSLKFPDLPEL